MKSEKMVEELLIPKSKHNERGEETPDPRPMALPIDFKPPKSIDEQIMSVVGNAALQAQLNAEGVETFEEADDFEMDEEPEPTSPHEENFDNMHIIARNEEIRAGIVRDRTDKQKNDSKALLEAYIAAKKQEAEDAAEDKKYRSWARKGRKKMRLKNSYQDDDED